MVENTVVAVKPQDETKIYDVLYNHRFRELDGLRGIASLMVGIDHGFGFAPILLAAGFGSAFAASAALVINGAIAVDLFFIMSGFFLAGMLENLRAKTVWRFYIRRLVRLVPPAVAAVVLLYVYARASLRSAPAGAYATEFYQQFYADNHVITHGILLLNLALIRHTLNPPLWTIRLEIFTSLIFPAVIFLKNARAAAWYKFTLFGVFLLIAVLLNNHQKLGIDVFHYLYIFYAGALVREFGQNVHKISPRVQYALVSLALLGLALTGEYDPLFGVHPILFDLPVTFFGTILVVLLAYGDILRSRRFMNSWIVQFLGRISYSFYLMNWLAMVSITALFMRIGFAGQYGNLTAVAVFIAAANAAGLVLAYALHVAVEQPATAFSRYLGARAK